MKVEASDNPYLPPQAKQSKVEEEEDTFAIEDDEQYEASPTKKPNSNSGSDEDEDYDDYLNKLEQKATNPDDN